MANENDAIWNKTKLIFNGHEYQLLTLLKTAAAGPKVEVALADIDLEPKGDLSPELHPGNVEIHEENVVLFKHNNKYIVLAGRGRVQRAHTNKLTVVKGNLLSTPALKKSRIVKDVAPAPLNPVLQAAPNTYDRNRYANQSYDRKPNGGPSRYR
jgi:hypothetical protein